MRHPKTGIIWPPPGGLQAIIAIGFWSATPRLLVAVPESSSRETAPRTYGERGAKHEVVGGSLAKPLSMAAIPQLTHVVDFIFLKACGNGRLLSSCLVASMIGFLRLWRYA
jgi:hypothetical protein